MDLWDFRLVAALIASAGLIGLAKGGLQIAGMFSVPVLSLALSPVQAAATLLPVLIASDMVGVVAYRKSFDASLLRILFPAALAGIAVGWLTAAWVPATAVMLLIGLIGLGYCLQRWLWTDRDGASPSRRAGWFWGGLSGFSSFLSHSGGAPYQIYMVPQKLDKLRYAGTTTILFAGVNLVKVVPYWALGEFHADTLALSLALIPVAMASVAGGVWLLRVVPEATFYRVLDVALFLVSLKLINDGVRDIPFLPSIVTSLFHTV